MSKFTCEINVNKDSNKDHILCEILGNEEYGLNKTIINAIRRTLLSSIETFAFRTTYGNSDIVIEKNETSLHNEFILDRIGLLPLYLNPNLVQDNPLKYLFVLNVKHDNSKPITHITSEDFDIYVLKDTIKKSSDYINGLITTTDKSNYDMSKTISDKVKQELFRPFQDKYYCLLHELKSTNSEENVQEIVLYGSPSVSIAKEDSRWQAVSCATYSFKIDPDIFETTLKSKIEINDIQPDDKESYKKELFLNRYKENRHRSKYLHSNM